MGKISAPITALLVTLLWCLPLLAATPVNINSADASTIASALDGIGEVKAQAIVDYREAHGPFQSIDELNLVSGIGAATLEKNRDAIRIDDDD